MHGITIGIGSHRHLAEIAAERFRAATSLPAKILGGEEFRQSGCLHPYLLRCRAFDFVDDDRVIYFDADLFFFGAWSPFDLVPETQLGVVRDLTYSQHVIDDAAMNWAGVGGDYFNSGLMVMSRESHRPMLHLAEQLALKVTYGRSAFLDQSALNMAARLCGCPITYLPRICNWIQTSREMLRHGFPLVGCHKFSAGQSVCDQIREGSQTNGLDVDFQAHFQAYSELAGLYSYVRVGHDDRLLELRSDGTIGFGSRRLETCWYPVVRDGVCRSVRIRGFHDVLDCRQECDTCELFVRNDNVLEGHWLIHECMEIRMTRQERADHFPDGGEI